MKIVENDKVQEKVYMEKLPNDMLLMIIPKKTQKKYIIWGVKYGSIDNHFKIDEKEISHPDGIAHYMEHKMFEQASGINSLDTLTSIGVEANAYTTNNHTAYLFEDSNDKFWEALDEYMNYIQNPYFTDENVEKERGIIGQEIMMYADYPDWKVYINTMKAMYHNNPVKIDIAGSKESIAEITKEKLYEAYHHFYRPENMAIVVCGDFEPEEVSKQIKARMTLKSPNEKVQRLYPEEPEEIVQTRIEAEDNITQPLFTIGYKDKIESENRIKKDLALNIICNILIGDSSELYQDLYKNGLLQSEPKFIYEVGETYAHLLIQGQSENYDEVISKIEEGIENLKKSGIKQEEFDRIKKKLYGEFVKGYNEVENIAMNFLQNYFIQVNPLDYFEEFQSITKEYTMQILQDVFRKDKKVISIVKGKDVEQ